MNVFVTRTIPETGLNLLRRECTNVTVYGGDTAIPRSELEDGVRNADGLLCLLTETIDAELMDRADNLKVVSNFAVGFDNIDLAAATERDIYVTNTPGVLTGATAELTWALLLATVRRVVEADQFVRDGKFDGWSPTLFRGLELSGKTLGILGAGRIGQAVGRMSAGFNMDLLYHSRRRKGSFEREMNAEYVDLDDLLTESDVLTLHCPSTDETRGLLDESALRSMNEGAYLINTARGDVVDESALVRVLNDGPLAGAGLDVYEEEPNVHPDLIDLDNVVLLPHIGSATMETRDEMSNRVARNLIAGLRGDTPPDLVNDEVRDPTNPG